MSPGSHILLAAILAATITGPARAELATPQGGAVEVAVTAFNDGPETTSTDSDSWAGAPTSLSAVSSLTLSSASGTVQVGGAAAADWTSADAGQIRFSDFGWDRSGSGGWALTSLCGTGCTSDPPSWSYSFVANADGGFHMNYDIVANGDHLEGLLGWQLYVNGLSDNYGAFLYADTTSAVDGEHVVGKLGAPLVAGHAYTVTLAPIAYSLGVLTDRSAYMDGVFDWTITTQGVPEPSTWLLMIGGFGLTGVALRRRRGVAV